MPLGAEMAQEDGDDERPAGESQLHRLRYAGEMERNRSEDDSKRDPEENGDKVGMGQILRLVADHFSNLVKLGGYSDHLDAVTHLQFEVGACYQLDTGAHHPRDSHTIYRPQAKVLETLAGERGFSDGHPAGHKRFIHLDPVFLVHRDLFAED